MILLYHKTNYISSNIFNIFLHVIIKVIIRLNCFSHIAKTVDMSTKSVQCKNCKTTLNSGEIFACGNCNLSTCEHCASETKFICPRCYGNLERK